MDPSTVELPIKHPVYPLARRQQGPWSASSRLTARGTAVGASANRGGGNRNTGRPVQGDLRGAMPGGGFVKHRRGCRCAPGEVRARRREEKRHYIPTGHASGGRISMAITVCVQAGQSQQPHHLAVGTGRFIDQSRWQFRRLHGRRNCHLTGTWTSNKPHQRPKHAQQHEPASDHALHTGDGPRLAEDRIEFQQQDQQQHDDQ